MSLSYRHGRLKWDAVPTKVEAPNPPPPLDVERKRKPPKTRQELPFKKRKMLIYFYFTYIYSGRLILFIKDSDFSYILQQ